MKIDKPADKPPTAVASATSQAAAMQRSGKAAEAKVAQSSSKSSGTTGVAVTVSAKTLAIASVEKSAADDIDMNKVQAIRSAIEGGTYVVNHEAIADKLLAGTKEMMQRSAGV